MFDRLIILAHWIRLRARHFRSRDHLLAWQDQQVQHFLQRIIPLSPFYQQHTARYTPDQWQTFPTINKALMMANFDTLNTAGIAKSAAFALALQAETERDFSPTINGITVGLSSGTSGNRGLFLVSKRERLLWVAAALAKVLPAGGWRTRQRIAFFLRANSNLYETIGSPRFDFQFFDLITPPTDHLIRLNRLQPTLLVAPPSMLRFLADHQQSGALQIAPHKVIAVAEVLDPLDEAIIAAQFGQRVVHQAYQATEGFLATTCEHGTLHLHEDMLAVQPQPLDPTGAKFTPIITDFQRTTQPIIRYQLNDILTARREPCPCGSPLLALEQIEGRSDDLFRLGEQQVIVFPDYIRRAVIRAHDAIRAYQVRQTAPHAITVALNAPDNQWAAVVPAVRTQFADLWRRVGIDPLTITLTIVPLPPEQPTTTKRKRVINALPRPYDSGSGS